MPHLRLVDLFLEQPSEVIPFLLENGLSSEDLREFSKISVDDFEDTVSKMPEEDQQLMDIISVAASEPNPANRRILKLHLNRASEWSYQAAAYLLFQIIDPTFIYAFIHPVKVSMVHVSDLEEGVPFRFFNMETYGGLDENDQIPSVKPAYFETFTPDGYLLEEVRETQASEFKRSAVEIKEEPVDYSRMPKTKQKRTHIGRFDQGRGPYICDRAASEQVRANRGSQRRQSSSVESERGEGCDESIFYYLTGDYSQMEDVYKMQICFDPLNVMSTDCMDEVLLWKPSRPE